MPESSAETPAVELPARGGAGRRASLVTFDQGISSASNLLMLIWVAHALSAADFGRFSLVFFVWVFTQTKKDRKSTRLNSSHSSISYAVFCLKKKKKKKNIE